MPKNPKAETILRAKALRDFLAGVPAGVDLLAQAANMPGAWVHVHGARTYFRGCFELLVRRESVGQDPEATTAWRWPLTAEMARLALMPVEDDQFVMAEIPNATGNFVPVLGVRMSRKGEHANGKTYVHVLVRHQSVRAKDVLIRAR